MILINLGNLIYTMVTSCIKNRRKKQREKKRLEMQAAREEAKKIAVTLSVLAPAPAIVDESKFESAGLKVDQIGMTRV